MLREIWEFISYWYFRYLMVTELYMVERWERNVINASAVALFCVFWYFNVNYVAAGVCNIGSLFVPSGDSTMVT